MTLYNRIIRLCDENGINQTQLEVELGFGKGTISKWKSNPNPSADKIIAMAERFNVSTDYILTGVDKDGLNEKDNRDIKRDIDSIIGKLSEKEYGPAAYDGNELSDESIELFKEELELALKRLKLINKEKYNPNKNKK